MFRDVILCLCLNLTFANVVRFPRELDRHGVAFLLPYIILFLLIGVPIILLEIALGQFLGQGSAHLWRASPIFRGKHIIKNLFLWFKKFVQFLRNTGSISVQNVIPSIILDGNSKFRRSFRFLCKGSNFTLII